MTKNQTKILLKELKIRLEYWRNNHNDPHGIGQAVYIAILEVFASVEKAADKANE
jgi:hypothetical protein